MTELLTSAQMRALEKAAIEAGEVTGLSLMERAGEGVIEAINETWPELAAKDSDRGAGSDPSLEYFEKDEEPLRAVVLCGPGNNGGDGFVIARLLRERGWAVQVFFYGEAEKLPPDARANYQRWCALGEVFPLSGGAVPKVWDCDLMVDALFGTGLTRALTDFGELFRDMKDKVTCLPVMFRCQNGRPAIVAVDISSGICADSGRTFSEEAPPAVEHRYAAAATVDLTVTFHAKKLGHVLAEGPKHCGAVVVKDIGLAVISDRDSRSHQAMVDLYRNKEIGRYLCHEANAQSPYLSKTTEEHKYNHGHALILSGGSGRTGAARLAARGALRIGAGLVTLGVPPAAQMEVACQITSLMLTRVEGREGLATVLEDKRINAICLGPGLGLERARSLVPEALACRPATVLDADALSAFAEAPDTLFAQLHGACVLTPHGGEFARLFPDIAEKLATPATQGPAYSKVDATRDAAQRAGCTVLFKGPDTVIADQTGVCAVHSATGARASPWLATGGAGDVLAGFIVGLLARGFGAQDAAKTAAWLHVECARHFGPGLIAEDLPEQLPHVLRSLEC